MKFIWSSHEVQIKFEWSLTVRISRSVREKFIWISREIDMKLIWISFEINMNCIRTKVIVISFAIHMKWASRSIVQIRWSHTLAEVHARRRLWWMVKVAGCRAHWKYYAECQAPWVFSQLRILITFLIMLPDGDLRIVLHLVPFWILTIWGSVHIEKTVVGWRNQLRMKTSAT